MNFFGHAVVAGWSRPEPRFVLGSMLPDFESMLRQRVTRVTDQTISDGIAFHHRTDAVFHGTPTFIALCRNAVHALQEEGVRRGTSRAVAHLATEMFLDGWLAHQDGLAAPYEASLQSSGVAQATIEWRDHGSAFDKLCARLTMWGPPTAYREPEFVLERLSSMLEDRDRLRIEAGAHDHVARFLASLQPIVEASGPELLVEVRNGLGYPDE